jgi:hypothetical protein
MMNAARTINKYKMKVIGTGKSRGKRLKYIVAMVLLCTLTLFVSTAIARTLTSNETGTHDGFYYSFWKDSGDATFELLEGGRYRSQWNTSTNNWVGGKGWNPGGPRIVNYEGYYGVDNSQNSYLALYGWTRNPLIEYYVVESYGSYNPATCSGGQDYGSFQSDGATYNVRRCQRVNAPCIEGDNCTFYQYFSVRSPKKGFGNISGSITAQNHFNYWASQGLNLGTHDYMVFATEGYQSSGSSDITVSEGGGPQPTTPPPTSVPPGGRIEAENYSSSGGTLDVCGGMLCYIEANAWTQYNGVNLPAGTNRIDLNVANGGGSTSIQVQIGGTNVGTLTVGGTGGWDTFQTQSLSLPAQSGVQNVRLVFVNGNVNVDWFAFSGSGPAPTNTPPGPTAPPPTNQPPGDSCSVYYSQYDWGSGATVSVIINNNSSSTINGWTLAWTFPGNQQITSLWNGSYNQSGASVSVSDAGWNGTIGANGGTASFGFNISYSGSNQAPTNFTLNGTPCE